MTPALRVQLEKFLDEIDAAAEGAMKAQLRADNKARAVNAVFEQGMVAGKLEAIHALVKSIRETLDE